MLVISLVIINVTFSTDIFPLVDRNMPFNKTYTVVVFGHGINYSLIPAIWNIALCTRT